MSQNSQEFPVLESLFNKTAIVQSVNLSKNETPADSMYLRVAFDSFAVRFPFIFREGLFACL